MIVEIYSIVRQRLAPSLTANRILNKLAVNARAQAVIVAIRREIVSLSASFTTV